MQVTQDEAGAAGIQRKIAERLVLAAPEHLRWEQVSLAPLREGELLARTMFSAVSVGSEYAWFLASERPDDRRPRSLAVCPRYMGYESLAVVEESRSERAKPGDRVAAMYGHCTAAVLGPSDLVIPVPADIPDAVALLSILACEAARGADRIDSPADPILLTGAGDVGLLALNRLMWWGARNVSILEPRPERRDLAKALGASEVLTAEQLPQPQRFAFGLECSSSNRTFRLLQQSMQHGGIICVLANGNYDTLELDPLFHSEELVIVGSSDGTDHEEHARQFFEHWRETKAPLEQIFDRRIEKRALIEAFHAMRQEKRPLRILIAYESDNADGKLRR